MFRPALRTWKPVKFFGRRSVSLSNTRGRISFVLPTSTVVAGLVGIGSAAYAYGLGLGNGRAAVSTHNAPLSKPKYSGPEEAQQAIKALEAALPGQVRVDPVTVEAYGFSPHTYLPSSPHAVYVAATSTEDVIKVVNISRKYKVPIIPFGAGNSLEGQFAGHPAGSICIDLSGMDKILAIHEEDGDLICQAGARWDEINRILEEKGIPLFFPLDPGPGSTIGGMIGTGCSGTNAVRYGTARAEWFLNVTVVLPSGEVIQTRRRARKSSAGFDTTKLFIGAEGTLGIVTEATLRLAPIVPNKVAMAQFPDVARAVDAVQEILRTPYGINIQCVELLDDNMINAINKAGTTRKPYPTRNSLFFKIQGAPEVISKAAEVLETIVKKHASSRFEFASTEEHAKEMWESRKMALFSSLQLEPGLRCWTTDVCVPVSRLPELVYETKKDLAEHGIKSTIVGHVGDGNFHALLLFKEDDELPKVKDAVHRIVDRAIAMDGTCTGEHGVGVGKKEFLVHELGVGTVKLMRTIKRAIDPDDLFNPGKVSLRFETGCTLISLPYR
ncbi:hypothetical protein BDM02DRAFT_3252840 [Thelephora ganbajun]|uniref:Uncharacterized protein n=1 Tax=Thelephora ganbajun TaxID=370292 RepID=A0ACB6ZAX9_THEGA|nr:hypothetical protein BDM02DRAFT_3252840 [Thelephora ganbajun]